MEDKQMIYDMLNKMRDMVWNLNDKDKKDLASKMQQMMDEMKQEDSDPMEDL